MANFAFFGGKIVPLEETRVMVDTHAFNYGTAVFEGIRGFWNEEGTLFVFALKEHYQRLLNSAKILGLKIPYTLQDLVKITIELLEKESIKADLYIRPIIYVSAQKIGVKIHGLDCDLTIFVVPFGSYFPDEENVRAIVSNWRRINDNAIPARAKVCGAYVNSALVKDQALKTGGYEAICLNEDGHVSEASAANIFLVRNQILITPPVTANILEGITRRVVIQLAEEMNLKVIEREVDRTELYIADEVFITDTACNISAITEIDQRPVGQGKIGPITKKLRQRYFQIVRGEIPPEDHWWSWITKVIYPI